MKKIDIHTHISTDAEYLREIMDTLNLKMFTICNEGLKKDRLKAQIEAAVDICNHYPRYYGWCTTFGFDRMFDSDWADRVKKSLEEDFENGALGVKVWKEIGMQLKDKGGNFIQIDNPVFDPIFNFVESYGKTLFAHIGDPIHQWLSVGTDGKQNGWYDEDRGVWNRIGEFRGEVSYDQLMLARDRMLEKYPGLRIVVCHMGSMWHDVDLVAERFEEYPNFAVDTSLTISHLMAQAREKVRDFFIKYQDRILYGADISGGLVPSPYLVDMSKINERMTPGGIEKAKNELLNKYQSDFIYFATDHEIPRGDYTIKGLALPEKVLKKIFYENAVNWVPGIEQEFV